MFSIDDLRQKLQSNEYDQKLSRIYTCDLDELEPQKERYIKILEGFVENFGDCDNAELFSAPGRTEIGGNHTDHQHGHVLAGSVNLDIIAVAAPNDSGKIRVKSEGFPLDVVDLNDLAINEKEFGEASSLIRGIAAKLKELGFDIKGFDAYTTSNVLKGSGLSSSAAFEVIIGVILNNFYCNCKMSPIHIAKLGQYAENNYFGKPSGLMDQMASSVGGVISIDFSDTTNPVIEEVALDLRGKGYALCIIDSGADHADLTDEYAAITNEMHSVANFFGREFLSEVNPVDFYGHIASLREKTNDRAILRGIHFFSDDKRVTEQVAALRDGDFTKFMELIIKSGNSSYKLLQNVFSVKSPKDQAVSLVLALCEKFLDGVGAYRVHGGGFAGTVQAFVPLDILPDFKKKIENVFGEGKCYVLSIRPVGGVKISE